MSSNAAVAAVRALAAVASRSRRRRADRLRAQLDAAQPLPAAAPAVPARCWQPADAPPPDPVLIPRLSRRATCGAFLGCSCRRRCRRRGHPVPPPGAASVRWATCSAGVRSTCRAGPGAMTPRWRSAGREPARASKASRPPTRWSACGAGSAGLSVRDRPVLGITASTARALARAQWRRQRSPAPTIRRRSIPRRCRA